MDSYPQISERQYMYPYEELQIKAIEIMKNHPDGILQSDLWRLMGTDSRRGSRIVKSLQDKEIIRRTWSKKTVETNGRKSGTCTYKLFLNKEKVELEEKRRQEQKEWIENKVLEKQLEAKRKQEGREQKEKRILEEKEKTRVEKQKLKEQVILEKREAEIRCRILKKHHKDLAHDPEHLSTEFILKLIKDTNDSRNIGE